MTAQQTNFNHLTTFAHKWWGAAAMPDPPHSQATHIQRLKWFTTFSNAPAESCGSVLLSVPYQGIGSASHLRILQYP